MQQLASRVVSLTSSSSSASSSSGSNTKLRTKHQSTDTDQTSDNVDNVASASAFLRLEFTDQSVVVLDAETVRSETLSVLKGQSITDAMPPGLRRAVSAAGVPGGMAWPEEEGEAGRSGPEARQARQQKRRLTVRR